jgi:hypothetical protein
MATFPQLSTGAVTQYSAPFAISQTVQVIRFLDGSDQRCLLQGKGLRRWLIHLELLNETEIQQIESFFKTQQGDDTSFTFPDPFSGTNIPNCKLEAPTLISDYLGPDVNSTSFWVIETNA